MSDVLALFKDKLYDVTITEIDIKGVLIYDIATGLYIVRVPHDQVTLFTTPEEIAAAKLLYG